jgi:hypothetical protein
MAYSTVQRSGQAEIPEFYPAQHKVYFKVCYQYCTEDLLLSFQSE